MWNLIKLSTIGCCFLQLFSTSSACTTCQYGFVVLDQATLSRSIRFQDNITAAENMRGILVDNNFLATNASDACTTYNACGPAGSCTVLSQYLFNCSCINASYEASRDSTSFSCNDVDECSNATLNNCQANATCSNTSPGYFCTCDPGFMGDGVTNCTDINECASDPCGLRATCTEPFVNNYTCTCGTYYTGDPYNSNCTDLDECSTNSSDCSVNANCTNTDPGFNCTCKSGFTGNGTDCQDIDECLNSTCHVNATCTNTPRSFYCTCLTGHTGDGVTSCTLYPKDISVTFLITCVNLNFDSSLQDSSSGLHYNVTTALEPVISAFVTRVDPSGIFAGVSYSFDSSADGYGDAQAVVTVSINNTILVQDDFLREVSTINETSQCGAVASPDECSLGIDNCDSDKTCANTDYGYCCYHDIDFRASMTFDWLYDFSIHSNLSHRDSADLCEISDVIATEIFDKEQFYGIRGCSQSITSVCEHLFPGSVEVVISFSIINATHSVTDLIDALQIALNDTYGVIAAGDFDECSSNYDLYRNCSAFATCLNFAGSFTCECNDTLYDNGTTPGQLCINPVTVNCNSSSNISVSLLSNFYTNHAVDLTDVHLAEHNCNYSTHAKVIGDSVEFTVAINDCNTNVTLSSDNSTVIASNYISNLPSTGVFTGKEFIVPFQCEFPASLNVSALFNGVVQQVSLPSVASVGGFTLEFNMYDSPSFSNVVVGPISSSLTVYGQISISNDITGVSVFMERCWGTPTSNPDDPEFHEFITNGCSNGNAVNFILYSNGVGSAQFSLQMFFFTQVNAAYMHCEVQVCTPSCISNCPARRRRRQAVKTTEEVTVTVQLKLDPNDPQFNIKSVSIIGINEPTSFNNNTGPITEPTSFNNNTGPITGINDSTSFSGSTVHDIILPILSAILAFVLIVLLALLVILAVRTQRGSKDNSNKTHVNMHAIGVKPPEY